MCAQADNIELSTGFINRHDNFSIVVTIYFAIVPESKFRSGYAICLQIFSNKRLNGNKTDVAVS